MPDKFKKEPMKDHQGFLEPEEIKKVINSVGGQKEERDKLLLRTLYATGARVSEIVGKKICARCGKNKYYNMDFDYDSLPEDERNRCECHDKGLETESKHVKYLRPNQLHPDHRNIDIWTLKRSGEPEERTIPVSEKLLKDLVKYSEKLKIGGDERIFKITRVRVFQIIRRAGKNAGISRVGKKPIHPHHFRHSHAVSYIRKNPTPEGIRKLQKRFKHGSIDTTSFYLQFGDTGEAEIIEDMMEDIE